MLFPRPFEHDVGRRGFKLQDRFLETFRKAEAFSEIGREVTEELEAAYDEERLRKLTESAASSDAEDKRAAVQRKSYRVTLEMHFKRYPVRLSLHSRAFILSIA